MNHEASWQLAGWTMLHFAWVGVFIGATLALGRHLIRRCSPNVRYAVTLVGFATLALAPLAIAGWMWANVEFAPVAVSDVPSEPAAISAGDVLPPEFEPLAARPPAAEVIDLAETPMVLDPSIDSSTVPADLVAPTVSESIAALPSAEEAPVRLGESALTALAGCVNYLPWLWIIGTPITLVLLATGLVGSERLRRHARPITEGPVLAAAERLRAALRLSRRATLAISDRVLQPVLVGIVRPMILLPPAAVTGWSPEELEMALLHELAHIRRWDNLVNLVQRVVEGLLFFHPCVWLVSRWLRADREQCCDAIVVRHTGDPEAYADLLVSVARISLNRPVPSTAVALSSHPLARRVRRILQLEDDPMLISKRSLMLVGVMFAALLTIGLWYGQPTSRAEETSGTREVLNLAEAPSDAEGESLADKLAARIKSDELIKQLQALKSEGRTVGLAVADDGRFHVLGFGEAGTHPVENLTDEEAEEQLLKLAFTPKNNNPIETRDHIVPGNWGRHSSYSLGDVLTAIQHDPFGPKLEFDWNWKNENALRLTAPKAAQWMVEELVQEMAEEAGRESSASGIAEATTEDTQPIVLDSRLTPDEIGEIENRLESQGNPAEISIDGESVRLATDDVAIVAKRIVIDGDRVQVDGAVDLMAADLQLDGGDASTAEGAESAEPSAIDTKFPGTVHTYKFPAGTPMADIRPFVAAHEKAGHQVRVIRRDGQVQIIATREVPPTPAAATNSPFLPLEQQRIVDLAYGTLNIEVEPFRGDLPDRFREQGFKGGVYVSSSNRSMTNLQSGDIVLGIHAWPTANLDELATVLRRQDLLDFNPVKVYLLRPQTAGGAVNGHGGGGLGFPTFSQSQIDLNNSELHKWREHIDQEAWQKEQQRLQQAARIDGGPVFRNIGTDPRTGNEVGVPIETSPDANRSFAERGLLSDVTSAIRARDTSDQVVVWCIGAPGNSAPCRETFNALLELKAQPTSSFDLHLLDFGAEPELAKRYKINRVPETMMFYKGQQVVSAVGLRSKADLRLLVEGIANLGQPEAAGETLRAAEDVERRRARETAIQLDRALEKQHQLADLLSERESDKTTGTPQRKLLYDGRTFAEWCDEWKTELKVENRVEAIKALRAFGLAGKGREATEAILEVAKPYQFNVWGDSTGEGALVTAIVNAFSGSDGDPPVPATVTVPILFARFEQDSKRHQWLLWHALGGVKASDDGLSPLLVKLAAEGDTNIRTSALYALVRLDNALDLPATQDALSKNLADEDRGIAIGAAGALIDASQDGFGGGGGGMGPGQVRLRALPPEFLPQLFHDDFGVRQNARRVLSYASDEQLAGFVTGGLFGMLEEIVRDPARPITVGDTTLLEAPSSAEQQKRTQLAAIRALAVLGETAKQAGPTLEKLLVSDDSDVRIAAFVAHTAGRGLQPDSNAWYHYGTPALRAFGLVDENGEYNTAPLEQLGKAISAEQAAVGRPNDGRFGGGGLRGGGAF